MNNKKNLTLLGNICLNAAPNSIHAAINCKLAALRGIYAASSRDNAASRGIHAALSRDNAALKGIHAALSSIDEDCNSKWLVLLLFI